VIGDGDSVVAILPGNWNFCTENDADARLIAAAPDLRDALKAICDMQARNYGDGMETHMALHELVEAGRAALAKAGNP
jgi:hypothetical protein